MPRASRRVASARAKSTRCCAQAPYLMITTRDQIWRFIDSRARFAARRHAFTMLMNARCRAGLMMPCQRYDVEFRVYNHLLMTSPLY